MEACGMISLHCLVPNFVKGFSIVVLILDLQTLIELTVASDGNTNKFFESSQSKQ